MVADFIRLSGALKTPGWREKPFACVHHLQVPNTELQGRDPGMYWDLQTCKTITVKVSQKLATSSYNTLLVLQEKNPTFCCSQPGWKAKGAKMWRKILFCGEPKQNYLSFW